MEGLAFEREPGVERGVLPLQDRFLDADDDHVTQPSIAAPRSTQDLDALHDLGTRVVGNAEYRLHLNHLNSAPARDAR